MGVFDQELNNKTVLSALMDKFLREKTTLNTYMCNLNPTVQILCDMNRKDNRTLYIETVSAQGIIKVMDYSEDLDFSCVFPLQSKTGRTLNIIDFKNYVDHEYL